MFRDLTVAAALLLGFPFATPSYGDDAPDWRALAKSDVEAAHALMLDHHPGPVDDENPGFLKQAGVALATALELSEHVKDAAGYEAVLRAYSAPFRDGHFGVGPKYQKIEPFLETSSQQQWPGIFLGWRAGQFTVIHALDTAGISAGATLIACDGVDADTLMRRDVFRFLRDKPDQQSYWARAGYRLLVKGQNPFQSFYDRCVFDQDGRRKEVTLDWQGLDEELSQKLRRKARFGARPTLGITEIQDGIYWINLPNFYFIKDEQRAAMQRLVDDVAAQQDSLRHAKAIVFDLHGNGGGSSLWGNAILSAVYGKDYVNQQVAAAQGQTSVHWRLSEGNITYIAYLVSVLEQQGQSNYAELFKEQVVAMAAARYQGDSLWSAAVEDQGDETQISTHPNPVKAKVFALTDAGCASACLDFMDVAFALGDVAHIGYPTASDTSYLEIRVLDLPSGYGESVIPIKTYRDRVRGNDQNYKPAHQYDAFDWSQNALQRWFLESVSY